MAKVDTIIKKIERFAPLETAQDWDNSGWQINLDIKDTKKIMLTLDVTPKTIEDAISNRCDLIISHHPLFFNSIKSIQEPHIIKAIQNNIQIYSAHTNLDIAKGGMSDTLAEKCGFKSTKTICDFVRYAKFKDSKNFADLINHIKKTFGVKILKVTNPNRTKYNSIAFCSGSGAEFISELEKRQIDVYITGDVKHHNALNAEKMTVIDLTHQQSEKFAVEIFEKILQNEEIKLVKAVEKSVWELI